MRTPKFLFLLPFLLQACSDSSNQTSDNPISTDPVVMTEPIESDFNVNRNAYFGELHVHSMYSYDAFILGGIASPDEAYQFAKGNAITHAAGFEMQLDQSFDFYAVTDHAYFLGVMREMAMGDSALSQHPVAEGIDQIGDDPAPRRQIFFNFTDFANSGNGSEIMDEEVVTNAWNDIVESANRHNDPGNFTTFVAYEYTGTGPNREMLHRNVIFRDSNAPDLPFSRLDSDDPADLWNWMDNNRSMGIESLAIPHNSNYSEGLMFDLVDYNGNPLDSAYADQRMRNEPLVEITQVKGTSETHPALSPNDEWANFGVLYTRIGTDVLIQPEGAYVRDALLNGIRLQEEQGFNPFKYGISGSSDTHNGTAVGNEDDFYGVSGLLDSNGQRRGSVPLDTPNPDGSLYFDRYARFGASGMTGVWAEENTREAIYDAFRRKETFGTSGPRLKVRFFAGHDLPEIDESELVAKAYETGVTMGGDLMAESDSVPSFIAWAAKDPNSAPLQRLQIIKGWVEGGEMQEQLYDIACSDGIAVDPTTNRCGNNGATVNLEDCSISSNLGASELRVKWTDPDYDPTHNAFYYVRALENPSCRWSTWDAIRAGVDPRPDVPSTIQERLWSSPIWIIPQSN